MTPADVQKLLVRLAAQDKVAADADPLRYPTPACVPLSRLFVTVENGDATGVDQSHLTQCEYCQAAVRKLRTTSPLEPEWNPQPPDEPAIPSEVFVRRNVWMRPEVSWAASFRSSPGDGSLTGTGEPVRPVAFAVGDATGGHVSLTPELAARYYEPELAEVGLKIILLPIAGGWEPRVELDPAPNRGESLVLSVAFPDGSTRTFVIPSGPPGSLDAAISDPAAALPAAAIGDPAAGWQGSVELT